MAFQYLFDPNKQFQSIGGVNEVSGFLRVFLNGTDDRATTYKNFDGTLNEADIVLDSYGRAVVIVDDTKTYRIEVYNRLGGLMWTVSNYKASGGSGGGSGTPVSVEGTVGEIDVDENTEGGVKHFVVGLAATIKNAIAVLTMAVNGLANALNGKKDKQTLVNESGSTTKTLVGIVQDENGEINPEFDDIAFPDWTSAINAAVATCEKLENKKTTVTGFESSTTDYPSIKAVVDFVNSVMQNLGGKLITDNGDPFTSSASLPSSTPYGGVDIADKDYAYVQNVGTAERWSATVSGSSVTWLQEYAISIPVFTPAQQAAIDSGATSTKVSNYDSHIANTNNPHGVTAAQVGALTPTGNGSGVTATFTAAGSRVNISTGDKLSVIFGKIAKWFGDLKAVAFSGSYNDLTNRPTIPTVNNGTLTITQNGTSKGTFTANQLGSITIALTDTTYESKAASSGGTAVSLVTTGEKFTWNAKQNAIGDLAEIRSGAAAGATALQPSGNGSNVTSTFTASSSRTNISSGEKLSTIFGKIAKWFSDLKSLAFKDKVSDSDISGTIADTHIASASTWNGKLSTSGDGSNVTATFSEAGTRSNIASGESLSTIFGKIKKFFSDLKSVAFTGNYSDLLGTPTIPAAANNGVLTIKQNGTSKGTFTANQSGNVTISLTDTTYENKAAAEGSPDVSLVTAGDKFDWNFAYRQLFKLTKYVAGSEATQGTAIELGEFSYGPGYRLRFTISIEDTSSNYTLGINIPFSNGVNKQWNGWLANAGNYEYCTQTEYRVGTSSPGFGVFGNSGTFPGIGQSRRIGDISIPRFSTGGIPVGMYRGKFLLSGYSDGVKSFVLDVDLCYKCVNSGTTWWGYVSLLPNDMHA